ncbi:MAG: glutamate--tRNA ligase, partial [Nitrospinota bacterium]
MRVRFAPSPTGPLHAGNVRTAVFNWLFARQQKGKFIIRIEDTDVERSRQEYTDEIVDSLTWLGMFWDEGPFFQSHHTSLYVKMLEHLAGKGKIYPCFCTEDQLEEDRRAAAKRNIAPVYSGRCRDISDEEREKRAKSEPYAPRFRVEGDTVFYHDAVRGDITVDLKQVGDFIVARSDGSPTYNFASAVDDAMMKISHVIRGEDHISNTPKQILLMRALDIKPPVYAHLPLILAEDGVKLSKRHSHAAFSEIMNGGCLPEAAWNFFALIGWSSEDKKEDMDIGELVEKFSFDRVALRPAQYNVQKLDWLNRQKIKKASPQRLLELGTVQIKKYEKQFGSLTEEKKTFLIDAVRDNITRLTELDDAFSPFFEAKPESGLKEAVKDYPAEKVADAFLKHCDEDDFKKAAGFVSEKCGVNGKRLYMPIRAALTGALEGPELKHIYSFLTPQERKERAKNFL